MKNIINNIDINNCTALLNLLTLTEVIADNTLIEDLDSGDMINLSELIAAARAELGI